MATGGGPAAEQRTFKLPCSISLTVSRCDIFETDADALVTGEDTQFRGEGMVSKKLLEQCARQYRKAREELVKKQKTKLRVGHVFRLPYPADGRSKFKFRMVYHAVVPRSDYYMTKGGWKSQMKEMYIKLLHQANFNETRCLAVPLLGSGGAGASAEDAEEVFLKALTSFQHKNGKFGHLRNVILYLPGEKAFSSMIKRLGADSSIVKGAIDTTNGPKKKTTVRSCYAAREAQNRGFPDDESNLSVILGNECHSDKTDAEAAMEATEEEFYSMSSSEGEEDSGQTERVNGGNPREEDEAKEKTVKGQDDKEEKCAICLDSLDDPKKLDKCGHTFCQSCIDDTFKHHKPACPTCNTLYGVVTGNQPLSATMKVTSESWHLPGYENYGTLVIDYNIPSGIQKKEHPSPGQPYQGTMRRAFLPDCTEGRKVACLLVVAFDNRLIFTIGQSNTTGRNNVVTWNDIHHKTSITGGPTGFGYPDPHYLSRVQEELAAKGVTVDSLKERNFNF